MAVTCGIDWASDHHDIALVDGEGVIVAKARITDDLTGLNALLELLTTHGDGQDTPIPVAIETSRGLLVACLRATGRPVYAINPMAAARYRERHAVSRKKSDHLDATVLANILRTDRGAFRALPSDTELVKAIAVLARAQQDVVWDRTQAANKLRSHLREYFPGFLASFESVREGLCHPVARELLAAAPTPENAARLTRTQLRVVVRRAGRQRGIEAEADRLREILKRPQMRQPPLVEQAMGRQARALLRQLDAACASADDLAAATVEAFETHPDATIITSFPGLGSLSGARILAEVGDDRSRFEDPKGLKAFAGAAPVTRASGKSLAVMARKVKNQRLAAVGYVWTFSAITASPGARAHYDRRREAGDRHSAAQRNLYNRFLGCLHHCLTNRIPYDHGLPHETHRIGGGSLTANRIGCLVDDDEGILGVDPTLTAVGAGRAVNGQSGEVGHGLPVVEQRTDQQRSTAVIDVHRPQHFLVDVQDVANRLQQGRLVIQDSAGQQTFAPLVDHHTAVMLLADVHPGPDLGHGHLRQLVVSPSRRRPRRRSPTERSSRASQLAVESLRGSAAMFSEPSDRLLHDSHTRCPWVHRSYE